MSEIFTNITIPNSWVWAKSKQIGAIINGDRGKNYPSRRHYITAGVPFISAGNLLDTRLAVNSFNYISEEKYNALNNGKLLKGDIIYCIRGTLGKCAIFDLNEKAAIASSLAILRLNELLNRYFVFYYLQSPYGSQLINKFDNGTAQPNLSAESFANYEIPLPPLPEQHRIVAKIEELFSSLDKGIESLKAAQQQLKVYRQAVLKWAFEGKLTNKNVVDGELPEGWKKMNLGDVSEKIQIGPFGTQLHKEDYITGGIPLINPMHFKDGIIESDASYSISKKKRDSLPNYILNEGDIIMGRRGETGRYGLVGKKEAGWFCGTGSLFIRPKSKVANSYFLLHCLKGQIVKKYLEENAAGTTMANLNSKIVNNIPIFVPSINEQHAIVAEIESRLSVCDKIEDSIEHSLKQSESLRQSILKKAFEGKLVPQDPNDEPASVLLDRIRKERDQTPTTKAKKRSRNGDN